MTDGSAASLLRYRVGIAVFHTPARVLCDGYRFCLAGYLMLLHLDRITDLQSFSQRDMQVFVGEIKRLVRSIINVDDDLLTSRELFDAAVRDIMIGCGCFCFFLCC